jgi:6-phosphogluconolactonase
LWLVLATVAGVLAAAAPAQAVPFVYVTNATSANVSQYDAAGGALAPLSPPTVGAGIGPPHSVAATHDGTSAYVSTSELYGTPEIEAMILEYSIEPGGSLTLRSSAPLPPNADPGALAASPDGRSLYVLDTAGSGAVIQYSVGAEGALTLKSPATVPAADPGRLAVSPDGRSVYVTNESEGSVSQYSVGADGALSPKSPAAVPAAECPGIPFGCTPIGVAVSPDSRSVYVANDPSLLGESGVISQYTAGTDGALSAKSPPTVPAGRNPFELAVTPDGQSVYVTDSEFDGTVLQYSVGADGTLSPKSPATVAAGRFPLGIAVTPDGQSVYAANAGDNTISQYRVDAGGGLSPRTPPTAPAGGNPLDIAVSPSPAEPPLPPSIRDCLNGGWREFGFNDLGECIRFAVLTRICEELERKGQQPPLCPPAPPRRS